MGERSIQYGGIVPNKFMGSMCGVEGGDGVVVGWRVYFIQDMHTSQSNNATFIDLIVNSFGLTTSSYRTMDLHDIQNYFLITIILNHSLLFISYIAQMYQLIS